MRLIRSKKVLLILAAALVGLVLLVSVALRGPQEAPLVAERTPTADPATQAEVEKLSRQLAEKYFTYTRPDSNDYLAGIKPFLSEALFARIAGENAKAGRFPNLPAVRSEVKEITVVTASEGEARSEIVVVSFNSQAGEYTQRARVHWKKVDNRWVAVSLLTNESEQNRERYREE